MSEKFGLLFRSSPEKKNIMRQRSIYCRMVSFGLRAVTLMVVYKNRARRISPRANNRKPTSQSCVHGSSTDRRSPASIDHALNQTGIDQAHTHRTDQSVLYPRPTMFNRRVFTCLVLLCDAFDENSMYQATQKAEDRMKITEDLVKEREIIISSLEAELTSYKNEVCPMPSHYTTSHNITSDHITSHHPVLFVDGQISNLC